MSTRQIQVCADRLPLRDRIQFLALIEHANKMFREAVELRRDAWRLYRASHIQGSASDDQ